MGLISFIVLSSGSSKGKKENLKSTLDYIHSKQRKLSQNVLKDSKANYIEALYDCPGNNEKCLFYYSFFLLNSPVSFITIDGEIFPAKYYHQFQQPGVRKVVIKFKQICNLALTFGENLISVDFSNFDTSELTNMEGLFGECNKLKSITWGPNFSTSKVTDMRNLFNGCTSLESVDLSKFNTTKVTNFRTMFNNCESLKELDISSFDASNAIELSRMFCGCKSLTSIDLNNFRPSKAELMGNVFNDCSSLKNVKFDDNFNARNVFSMNSMFENCRSLETEMSFICIQCLVVAAL